MNPAWSKWAPIPLRVVLGVGFLIHGFPKLFTGSGHDVIVGMIQQIGLPAAGLLGWIVAIVEVFGGLALILGAFVSIVSVLFIIQMLVAMFTVHWPNGFNFVNVTGMTEAGPQFGMPGYEVNLLYIAGLLALFLRGPSHLSVDETMAQKKASGGPPGGTPGL